MYDYNITKYGAFEKSINIKLFNDVISFIMETTDLEYSNILLLLKEKHIWFQYNRNNKIQNELGFNYFGELLERYGERVSSDIKDIRAITLAIAYSIDIISEKMIIGTQLTDFITKVKELSKQDIYLKGALFLIDNNKFYNSIEELKNKKYEKTEELLFTISLFDDFSEAFNIFKDQLLLLLGENRTISVINNIGIYNWLIKRIYPIVSINRKKELELLRMLIKIPTFLVKEDSKEFIKLIENGYTKEEIAFLNYSILYYKPVPDTVRMGKSIVEGKIALNFCKTFLNSDKEHSEEMYDYISYILNKYHFFDVKCYGYERILDALLDCIYITNPITFVKFYETFNYRIFGFDILDDKWDILKDKINNKKYLSIFDKYLIEKNYNKEKILECIKKYEQLTNTLYIKQFSDYDYCRYKIFSFLVNKEIIILEDWFEKNFILEENENRKINNIQHLIEYVSEIGTREAFLFVKYFFETYNIMTFIKLGFKIDNIFNIYSEYSTMRFKREFLSNEEHKQLLVYLDRYIFYKYPKYYIKFIINVLHDDFISTIIPKEELRKIYKELVKNNIKIYNNWSLKEKYLTAEELENEIRKEEEEKQRTLLKIKKETEDKLHNEFLKIEDKNIKEIFRFYNRYYYYDKEICCDLIEKYVFTKLSEYKLNEQDLIYFNKLCNEFLENNRLTIYDFKKYINIIIEEETEYANNVRTY